VGGSSSFQREGSCLHCGKEEQATREVGGGGHDLHAKGKVPEAAERDSLRQHGGGQCSRQCSAGASQLRRGPSQKNKIGLTPWRVMG